MTDFIQNIKYELQKPLPGLKSQAKMAPAVRLNNYNPEPEGARKGGVLLLLFYKKNELQVTFIKRAEDGGTHSGQISFPGGKYEEDDKDLIQTAKRETFEEVGVNAKDVKILGELSSLYIPVSNYIVYPSVGFVTNIPEFTPNIKEVSKVLVFPLKKFLSKEYKHTGVIEVRNQKINTPFYNIDNTKIWGATAMIMSEFSEIINRL